MGKPFKKELSEITNTYKWAAEVELQLDEKKTNELVSSPALAVGSGGSLSACSYLSLLHQSYGNICKAVTPLELYYSKNILRNSNVIFLSASGKNSDILFAYNLSVKQDAKNILSICMKTASLLAKQTQKFSIANILEFNQPSGKDGFLATNSLVSFFVMIARIYKKFNSTLKEDFGKAFHISVKSFVEQLDTNFTIQVLYGGWGTPVAIDIESKFTEAGLGNILLADFRNFAHGRHNWFDKKKQQSAVLAIITPDEKALALKTLSLLPQHIPKLILESTDNTPNASIELLIKSFYLVNEVGEHSRIDPGRPGVPAYGSKLYNLKYANFYKPSVEKSTLSYLAISRKIKTTRQISLSKEQYLFWEDSFNNFRKKITSANFAGIIFDYDGTLCASDDRYIGISESLKAEFLKLVYGNLIIGIVTGRGQSVRKDMQKCIPKEFHKNIIIGYYNGSQTAHLGDNNMPDASSPKANSLAKIVQLFDSHQLLSKFRFEQRLSIEPRPEQITIQIKDFETGPLIKEILLDLVAKFDFADVKILESSHSIDIIMASVSKLNILEQCIILAGKGKKKLNFLCIGDCGKWPGNDYQLLSSEFGLSVDQVSTDPDTCWNLAGHGIRNIDATIEYLRAIKIKANSFTIKL